MGRAGPVEEWQGRGRGSKRDQGEYSYRHTTLTFSAEEGMSWGRGNQGKE